MNQLIFHQGSDGRIIVISDGHQAQQAVVLATVMVEGPTFLKTFAQAIAALPSVDRSHDLPRDFKAILDMQEFQALCDAAGKFADKFAGESKHVKPPPTVKQPTPHRRD